ncbi:MAG: Sapep family Mn(2+)-dependent dipeptidase [Erysipelotrichaceae bacterium]
MDVKLQVEQYREEMIKDLATLVSYNSELDESDPKYPFGLENARCLEAALQIFENYGFKTTNLENYCGYGEVGSGEKLIGILGHMDIVPVGEGWDSDPLTLTQRDGKLFARGSSDDKGPVIAALYALRILMDNKVEFNKRIRLIVGSNEETGSKCLAHYVEKEGHIDYGFTPDGAFPGIHGEKGHISGTFFGKTSSILAIEGGVAKNVVCAKVKATLKKDSFNIEILKEFLEKNKLTITFDVNENVDVEVKGVSAHAAGPQQGINAFSYLMVGLKEAGMNDLFVDAYNQVIGLDTNGEKAHVQVSDEYGALTLNVGVVKKENDEISFTMDIRYPVTLSYEPLIERLNASCAIDGCHLEDVSGKSPLFYDPQSPMIQSLLSAYHKVTKDYDAKPFTIGGGTYSQGINNCIAFGGGFPGAEDTHAHDANEFITIDHLLLQTEIYVEAILNLLAL